MYNSQECRRGLEEDGGFDTLPVGGVEAKGEGIFYGIGGREKQAEPLLMPQPVRFRKTWERLWTR